MSTTLWIIVGIFVCGLGFLLWGHYGFDHKDDSFETGLTAGGTQITIGLGIWLFDLGLLLAYTIYHLVTHIFN